jgi:sugar lactone lactonase YvrE
MEQLRAAKNLWLALLLLAACGLSSCMPTLIGSGNFPSATPATSSVSTAVSIPWSVYNESFNTFGDLVFPDTGNNVVRKISASTGIISTIVGTDPTSSTVLGGAYTSIFDSSGNLLVTDQDNSVIRKYNLTNGTRSIIAGNGTNGYSGDGGQATSASLNQPQAIALDSAGNLYIADTYNYAVRKVNMSTGVITTIAGTGVNAYSGDGGQATSAKFGLTTGIAVDSSNNVYISDHNHNSIRKITVSTGIVTRIVGTGTLGYSGDGGQATSAKISNPDALVLDSSGNLYFADEQNCIIRKVTAAGVISTIAGTPSQCGYSGDGAAATSAKFARPYGIALDGAGDLYVADNSTNVIRKVSALTGFISTIAGIAGESGDTGDGGPATSASLNYCSGVTLDSAGDVVISDTHSHAIRKVDAVTGNMSQLIGSASGYAGVGGLGTQAKISSPQAIAYGSAGDLIIANSADFVVQKISATTGIITTIAGTGVNGYSGDGGPATSATLGYIYGLSVDASGNIYVADLLNSRIRMISGSTGIITTVAGTGTAGYSGDGGLATAAKVNQVTDVIEDASGNFYIADYGNNVIRKVTVSTGIITTIAGIGTAGYTGDLGLATSAKLNGPQNLAFDTVGDLYFSDNGNQVIRKINASGIITTVAGSGTSGYAGDGGLATSAQLSNPQKIAIDNSGNLLIMDSGNNVIRKVTVATGIITPFAGTGVGAYSGDGGLATSAQLSAPN